MGARRQTLAQAGGDPNVLAHPGFRTIPECLLPLATEPAKKEYDTLARVLFNAGHLTADKHRALSSYVAQFDNIHRCNLEGRPIRANAFIQMDKARAALKLDDLDKPIAAPEGAPTNKFARCGFANRRR